MSTYASTQNIPDYSELYKDVKVNKEPWMANSGYSGAYTPHSSHTAFLCPKRNKMILAVSLQLNYILFTITEYNEKYLTIREPINVDSRTIDSGLSYCISEDIVTRTGIKTFGLSYLRKKKFKTESGKKVILASLVRGLKETDFNAVVIMPDSRCFQIETTTKSTPHFYLNTESDTWEMVPNQKQVSDQFLLWNADKQRKKEVTALLPAAIEEVKTQLLIAPTSFDRKSYALTKEEVTFFKEAPTLPVPEMLSNHTFKQLIAKMATDSRIYVHRLMPDHWKNLVQNIRTPEKETTKITCEIE